MNLLFAVISGYLLALAAPWLRRALGDRVGYLIAVLPVGLVVYFSQFLGRFQGAEAFTASYEWIPSVGLAFSLYLDGLSLFFALLISTVGGLVAVYAGGYLHGDQHSGPFFTYMLCFMASMLGLVLAGNVLTLYVFWELTTITSFLLIGFEHQRQEAREAATKSLIVTTIGGLAMLVGLLMLGQIAGTYEIGGLLEQGDVIREDPRYEAVLALILLGAFAKSAQFPFHFWLPAAMEAPTPVSAYLHSATMVKAGIYLLARLLPVLGDTELWRIVVTTVGATTMLTGAWLAFFTSDLKGILAYLTINVLGTLTMLLGVGTDAALKAAMVYWLAHALYKGALFLVAGAVSHESGARDIHALGGLRRTMPLTAALGLISALSMAGVAPLLGFLAKEMFLEATWEAPQAAIWLTTASVTASFLLVAGAGLVGVLPFFGAKTTAAEQAHEASFPLWISPLLLTVASLVVALFPQTLGTLLIEPAVGAIRQHPVPIELKLWHGVTVPFVLSLVALFGGVLLYLFREPVWRIFQASEFGRNWGPDACYERGMKILLGLAAWQTRLLQSGYLRRYVLLTVATTTVLVGMMLPRMQFSLAPREMIGARFHEAVAAALILCATLVAVWSDSRFRSIIALGVIGFNVAWLFNLFGAPDLAMTQLVIESLLVLLFVLSFYRLPSFSIRSSRNNRIRDAALALTAGGVMTILLLLVSSAHLIPSISDYYAQQSVPRGHGRNVVNVILVDFRALDTLGEITVLTTAAIGVYTLTKLVIAKRKTR